MAQLVTSSQGHADGHVALQYCASSHRTPGKWEVHLGCIFAKVEDEHSPVQVIVLSIQACRRVRLHEGTCVCHLVSLSLDPSKRTS